MKKKIIFVCLFFILTCLPMGLAAQAQTDSTLDGLNETAGQVSAFKEQTTNVDYKNFLQTQAGQIISVVLSFVGVLFLILMIYAGITWMTAQGNEQQVTKAKSLLINAVIGIIIVFAAYALVTFIGDELIK